MCLDCLPFEGLLPPAEKKKLLAIFFGGGGQGGIPRDDDDSDDDENDDHDIDDAEKCKKGHKNNAKRSENDPKRSKNVSKRSEHDVKLIRKWSKLPCRKYLFFSAVCSADDTSKEPSSTPFTRLACIFCFTIATSSLYPGFLVVVRHLIGVRFPGFFVFGVFRTI